MSRLRRYTLGLLRRLSPLFNDETYLKIRYRLEMGRALDLDNPRTMNEKLQWLKIHFRRDELTDIVDKIKVKEIMKRRLGARYVVPLLKTWSKPEDITQADIDALPQSFVIKTNHSGGNTGVMVVPDKSKLNLGKLRRKMAVSLGEDIYRNLREWPYKNVDKRIFAEEYLGDDPVDYKFYCFDGEVDVVLLCVGRQEEGATRFYFFDRQWQLRRYNKAGKAAPADFTLPKPDGMDEMFDIASRLSEGFPFVRVDLYNVKGRIYFGELTFFPASGFDANRLPEADLHFGSKIDLNKA